MERDIVSFSCEILQKTLPRDDFQTIQFALLFTRVITETPSIHNDALSVLSITIHNVSAVSDPTPFCSDCSHSPLLSDVPQPLSSLLLHGPATITTNGA